MKLNKGFTLVELMLASAIFLIVIVAMYSSFRAGLFGYKNISAGIEISQKAKLTLERINTDLKNSFLYQQGETKFSGSADAISFLSLADTYSADQIITEYSWISYKVVDGALIRSYRKNQLSLNNSASPYEQELTWGIKEFVLTYLEFDEAGNNFTETNSWQKTDKLPDAVKVKIIFIGAENNPFERTIYR